MKQLLDAIKFANRRHAGQVRRGTGEPYVTHVLAVSYIVAAYKRSKRLTELLTVSVLHDILEDTDTTFEELARKFSPFVASVVLELTNDEAEIRRVGKLEYQTRKLIGMSSYALVVKLADRLHNISDSPTAKMLSDTLELMKRLSAGRKLTSTQRSMVAEIERQCREKQTARSTDAVASQSSQQATIVERPSRAISEKDRQDFARYEGLFARPAG